MIPLGEAVGGGLMKTLLLGSAAAIGSALIGVGSATAANLPSGFIETEVASFPESPTCMEFSPDGKLFIAQQNGVMPVWKNGRRLAANFFANRPLLTDTLGERGLLGIAFDPNFATNRFVYVYYTTRVSDHHNRVSRFTADSSGNLAVAGSEAVIWEGDPHGAEGHNGGAIHFGPDGKLYIATGDNTNGANSQSLSSQHGKILRVNPNGSVPADNPFTGSGTRKTTVWSLGLRNPFTFTFQPGTGRMFVNDVGQKTWEEINDGGTAQSGRGLNYGWPTTEGDFSQTSFPDFTRPFFAYNHRADITTPSGNVITGGAFYSPATNTFGSAYEDDYFFADLRTGWIYRIDLSTKQVAEFATNAMAVDLKVTDDGSLYYLAYDARKVFRVTKPGTAPVFSVQPQSQTVVEGGTVRFTAQASGSPSYQWERSLTASSWTAIPGATSGALIFTAQLSDNGNKFRVKATNAGGTTTSAAATLTVTGTGALPTPWKQTDVGSVGTAGKAVFFGTTFEVDGAGFIRGRSDSFHFVYQQATGDCTITARVSDLTLDGRRDRNARAGVMIRNSLADGAPHMFIGPKAKGPLQMIVRTQADRASDVVDAGQGSAPEWVRVTRVGNELTSYRSANGVTWDKVRSRTITLGSTVFIGLAVCSDEAGLQSASFDNVTAQP